MPGAGEHLPYVDRHPVAVEADPAATWDALLRVVEGSFSSAATARVARLLGCTDTAQTGPRPLATGSTIPGFHVEVADPARELALLGGHRFSEYALIFGLEPASSATTLTAETRATFPGLRGCAYRALVIGSRGHVVVVHRLLRAVKRRAERSGELPGEVR